jgi:hypothetical protein
MIRGVAYRHTKSAALRDISYDKPDFPSQAPQLKEA